MPAVVDLAAMRSAMARNGGDPSKVDPLVPADLIIDHSVQVDLFRTEGAYAANIEWEYRRNAERYTLLRWAQQAFDGLRVVPPGAGICHQVNLEHLGQVVTVRDGVAFPDTLVGTDSHTTMINGLGVLGWGVGGIEAEAAMLGQPMFMPQPLVIGVRTIGSLPAGTTATDLVLTLTQMLRSHGVVGRFIEFFGDGLSTLSTADRATLSNMCPEYGATAAYFPVDAETLRYLAFTGRGGLVDVVERYTKEQGCSAPTAIRIRCSPRCSTWTCPRSFRRSPDPSDRRIAWRCPTSGTRSSPPSATGPSRIRSRRRSGDSSRKAGMPRWPSMSRDHRAGERDADGRQRRYRPARLGGDRRHHQLHEHIQPLGHARRRSAREESRRGRPGDEAVGEDQPGARLAGRDRLPGSRRPDAVPGQARVLTRGLRVHDVHRELRAAARGGGERRWTRAT